MTTAVSRVPKGCCDSPWNRAQCFLWGYFTVCSLMSQVHVRVGFCLFVCCCQSLDVVSVVIGWNDVVIKAAVFKFQGNKNIGNVIACQRSWEVFLLTNLTWHTSCWVCGKQVSAVNYSALQFLSQWCNYWGETLPGSQVRVSIFATTSYHSCALCQCL